MERRASFSGFGGMGGAGSDDWGGWAGSGVSEEDVRRSSGGLCGGGGWVRGGYGWCCC
jgi:hypothetical protein